MQPIIYSISHSAPCKTTFWLLNLIVQFLPHMTIACSYKLIKCRSRSYYSSGNYGYQRPSDPQRVIWGLIGLNVAGFMAWRVDPRFMSRQATVSYSALAEGRVWTLVTAAFSHYDPWHLAANMFTFYFFASTIPHLYGGTAVSSSAGR